MYLSHYKLREFPFCINCDEKYFFESAAHAEALANMLYAVQQRKGMVLVTGEAGAGKTFLSNMLANRLGLGCMMVIMKSPPQSGKQLLRAVAQRAGLNLKATADRQQMIEALEDHLTRMQERGRLVALVIDEAQDLSASSLEELRLLWNWESGGQRLIQIVLIGQPTLRQVLLEPRWEPLRQRIILSYNLPRLGKDDTAAYIRHRLRVAGGEETQANFSESAVADVHAATDGIPRLINVLCDNALLVGYARGTQAIDSDIVNEVVRDMTFWALKGRDAAAVSAVAG